MVSDETLLRLADFDTPTICNVIELFDVRPRDGGFLDHRIRALFPGLRPMVGFAATASFRSAGEPPPGGGYADLVEQVERFETLPGPPVVVFQDLDDPPVGATFGEIMCSVYQAHRAVGLITSGGGRDLEQVARLEFPVFAGSVICSHGYCRILHLGEPVHVGGVTIREGDLLHGDANGVTTIPPEIASEVAEVAAEFVAAERILIDYAQGPSPKSIAGLRAAHRDFQDAVERLRRTIRSRRSA